MASTPPPTDKASSPKSPPTEESRPADTATEEPTGKTENSEPTPSTSTSEVGATDQPTEQDEPAEPTPAPAATPWQAIFSPQFNAYYFYNAETQQTTWENPLAQTTSPSTPSTEPDPASTPSATTPYSALHAAALQAGIDPSLAHLDPSLLSSLPGAPGPGPTSFTAKFNARTGQFTRPDARDPTHLSEHARATRMSEFYFDVKAWEEELARRGGALMGEEGEGGAEGKKRKRPSKKDLVGVLAFLFFFLPLRGILGHAVPYFGSLCPCSYVSRNPCPTPLPSWSCFLFTFPLTYLVLFPRPY